MHGISIYKSNKPDLLNYNFIMQVNGNYRLSKAGFIYLKKKRKNRNEIENQYSNQ